MTGAAEQIIKDLEIFGLQWDGGIYFQSENLSAYHRIIEQLLTTKQLYPCICSRKTLAAAMPEPSSVYPGTCLLSPPPLSQPAALRIKTDDIDINFQDRLHGWIQQNLAHELGDFIIQRKDRIIAYQLAVVIDDYRQHVSHVVRGFDLLDSTPRQIFIQQLLGYRRPDYMHVPLIVDDRGFKLSKQTHALAVNTDKPAETLYLILTLLKQEPPTPLRKASVTEILDWAIAHWEPQRLKKIRAIH